MKRAIHASRPKLNETFDRLKAFKVTFVVMKFV